MAAIIAMGAKYGHHIRVGLFDNAPDVRDFFFASFSVLVAHWSC